MARRIAIVEDEAALRENYAAVFARTGYEVATYAEPASALQAFQGRLPDLVILDIGLGDEVEGGFDLCRELRSISKTLPIIFLTARDSDLDTISGLRLGADDYLSKEISMPHVLARIAALLRRVTALSQPVTGQSVINHGLLNLDVERLTADWDGQRVDLTLTEFWLVHCLARRPGHVRNRDQLMRDGNIFVDDGTITSHIKRIRKKFKIIDTGFDEIDTVYGMGYRWRPG